MSINLSEIISSQTGLQNEDMEMALSFFKPVTAKKNEILLKNGRVADRIFFIEKGCLRLYYGNENHGVQTRFMAFEQTFLTSIVSFITGEPAAEYIQAMENSELKVISRQDFIHLRTTLPAWDKMYIYILEYGLTVINSKLSSLITQNAVERYRSLLDHNPELIQRLSNVNLAAYLNISPETLSRLKSQV